LIVLVNNCQSTTANTGGALYPGMNISNAVERIKTLGDLVEKLIQQSNELRERVIGLEENTENTRERLAVVEAKVDRQTALLEALAREGGIDPESVYANAGLEGSPAEIADERLAEADGDRDDGGEGDGDRGIDGNENGL